MQSVDNRVLRIQRRFQTAEVLADLNSHRAHTVTDPVNQRTRLIFTKINLKFRARKFLRSGYVGLFNIDLDGIVYCGNLNLPCYRSAVDYDNLRIDLIRQTITLRRNSLNEIVTAPFQTLHNKFTRSIRLMRGSDHLIPLILRTVGRSRNCILHTVHLVKCKIRTCQRVSVSIGLLQSDLTILTSILYRCNIFLGTKRIGSVCIIITIDVRTAVIVVNCFSYLRSCIFSDSIFRDFEDERILRRNITQAPCTELILNKGIGSKRQSVDSRLSGSIICPNRVPYLRSQCNLITGNCCLIYNEVNVANRLILHCIHLFDGAPSPENRIDEFLDKNKRMSASAIYNLSHFTLDFCLRTTIVNRKRKNHITLLIINACRNFLLHKGVPAIRQRSQKPCHLCLAIDTEFICRISVVSQSNRSACRFAAVIQRIDFKG